MRVSGGHSERKVRRVFKSPDFLELMAQLMSSSLGCGHLSMSSSTRCYQAVSAVHPQGLWSEFCHHTCVLGAMAVPRLCEERLLMGQEGLKHRSDPDVSGALAPAWMRYRSKPGNVTQISSSLIMNLPPPPYWILLGNVAKRVYRSDLATKASSRLSNWGEPLPGLTCENGNKCEMWNLRDIWQTAGHMSTLTTPETCTRYAHFQTF